MTEAAGHAVCSSEDGSRADCPRTWTCLWVLQIFRLGNLRAVSHSVSHATCSCEWVPGDNRKQGRADPENPALVSACRAVAAYVSCLSCLVCFCSGLLLAAVVAWAPCEARAALWCLSFKGRWRLAWCPLAVARDM